MVSFGYGSWCDSYNLTTNRRRFTMKIRQRCLNTKMDTVMVNIIGKLDMFQRAGHHTPKTCMSCRMHDGVVLDLNILTKFVTQWTNCIDGGLVNRGPRLFPTGA